MLESVNFDQNFDYLLYTGSINHTGYSLLTNLLELAANEERKDKVILLLITNGGDADAGYRISRALGHHYPEAVKVFVPDVCKSAGTLITVGSSELIISDRGELGPLDVQFAKKEELFEMSSGLDILKSLQVLKDEMMYCYREFLLDLRLGGGLGTKLATKLASEMASNLITPIASQIDPLRVGEHQRALIVAREYGKRLKSKFENISDENIDKLTLDYPSHSFVIDRKEASDLFNHVRAPNEEENQIENELRKNLPHIFNWASDNVPKLCRLTDLRQQNEPERNEDQQNEQTGDETTGDEVQDIG